MYATIVLGWPNIIMGKIWPIIWSFRYSFLFLFWIHFRHLRSLCSKVEFVVSIFAWSFPGLVHFSGKAFDNKKKTKKASEKFAIKRGIISFAFHCFSLFYNSYNYLELRETFSLCVTHSPDTKNICCTSILQGKGKPSKIAI